MIVLPAKLKSRPKAATQLHRKKLEPENLFWFLSGEIRTTGRRCFLRRMF